ncbi:retinal pigment epithelial membrane family protein [Mycena leptocephala]|nr:retinal pigment epithelial membrane family protein [Mycena leptocephala]
MSPDCHHFFDCQRSPDRTRDNWNHPAYAAGTLLRTGPGSHKLTTEDGEFSCSHWFDGFSHLYRFELVPTPDGTCKVLYSSRRQVDALIERVRKTGRLDGVTFGQKRDPCDSLFKKVKTTFEATRAKDPELVNVGVSISANVPGFASDKHDHDPETLAPLGVTDQTVLHQDLTGELSCAHPEFDPQTGDIFNYNLKLGPTPVYRLSGKDAKAAYLHSFFLTENFLILCIWPAHFANGGAWVLWQRNMLDALADFDPSAKTKWFRWRCRKFESSAMFAFHTVNAYEVISNDGRVDIICDVMRHRNLDVLKKLYYDNLVSSAPSAGKRGFDWVEGEDGMGRFRLSDIPAAGKPPAREPRAADLVFSWLVCVGRAPTINPAYHTKAHRYIYGVADRRQSSFHDTLTCTAWSTPGHTPGEPIFVADPAREGEDDGVVLSVVLDGASERSYLLVLDAKSWVEVGRAEVPGAVGFGFHGAHFKLAKYD